MELIKNNKKIIKFRIKINQNMLIEFMRKFYKNPIYLISIKVKLYLNQITIKCIKKIILKNVKNYN